MDWKMLADKNGCLLCKYANHDLIDKGPCCLIELDLKYLETDKSCIDQLEKDGDHKCLELSEIY